MRRREFLRAALGAVAGLAVGAPVLARPRPSLLDGLAGYWQLDEVQAWPRVLTATERAQLYNQGVGVSLRVFQKDLVSSRFFSRNFQTDSVSCPWPESAANTTDEESHDGNAELQPG